MKEVNQSEEKTVVQVEDDYVNEVLDKIYKLYEIYDRYHRSSVRFEQAKAEIDAIPFREEQLNTYKEEFKNATEVASRITAEEDKEMKPTEYVKAALTQAFDNLVAGSKLARAGYKARRDDESSYEAKVSYSKEQRELSELVVKLERITLTQKVNEEREKSSLAIQAVGDASIHNSTVRDSSTSRSMIKMNKVECPKFSGYPRDFAQFKDEFESIVAVPGRQDNEGGGPAEERHPQEVCPPH